MMPLPWFSFRETTPDPLGVTSAAAYGASIGAFAALFWILGVLHQPGSAPAYLLEIAGAALVFAVLCAGAAALRNFIVRRLI